MIANMESISKRVKFLEQGLFILMGLPNATSVNQEMDALYGAFKSAFYARGEVILTERLRMKGLRNSARATVSEKATKRRRRANTKVLLLEVMAEALLC